MANLITQSLTFEKESVTEFFLKPLFVTSDFRDFATVRTNVQGTEKLDLITKLENITLAYQTGTAFTPSAGVTVEQKDLIVSLMKAEVQQSGSEFFSWVKEAALKKGVDWDNIEGTIFEEIVASVFFRAVKRDLQRQLFFGDKNKETLTNGELTGIADVNFKEYDGWWTRFLQRSEDGDIAASQRFVVQNAAVKQIDDVTLTGTSGTANVVISGKNFLATFNTDLTTTASDFVVLHTAALKLRLLDVSSAGAVIKLTSRREGQQFSSSVVNLTGNLAGSSVTSTANVEAADLGTDEGISILTGLWDAATNELLEFDTELRYIVTRSIMTNYMESLEALNGSDAAHTTLLNGIPVRAYRGVPIIVRPEWDNIIDTKFSKVFPHRAILSTPENMVYGTDLADADSLAEMFYDQTLQKNFLRVQYKAGTQHFHDELVTLAF